MSRVRHTVPVDQLWADYVELGTLERVAQRYGCSRENVRDRLARAGYKLQARSRVRDRIPLDPAQLWADYQRLGTCSAVARVHGVQRDLVERRLNRAGYKLRKGPRRVFNVAPAQLWADYQRLGSLGAVAQQYRVSWAIVRRRLINAGYKLRGRGPVRRQHPRADKVST